MRYAPLESNIYGDTPISNPFVSKYLNSNIGVGRDSYSNVNTTRSLCEKSQLGNRAPPEFEALRRRGDSRLDQ